LAADKSFLSEYKNHFDVVFFSPPYYRLELYPGSKQSTTTYKTYEEWLTGYWEETIRLCKHVLVPGGRLCYILSGYGTDGEYDLLNDMNNITQKYFKLKSKQTMYNKNVNSTEHRETSEQIMIWGNQGFPINPILL
jgi:tRNA1(Val) A37 N6-methylase TrmN6